MGVELSVGALAFAVRHDAESAAWLRRDFAAINRQLAPYRLRPHDEPERLPPLRSRAAASVLPYSHLHHLRRVFARLVKKSDWRPEPVAAGANAADDPALRASNHAIQRAHLVCHADDAGYYLPQDFDFVIAGGPNHPPPGGPIGSSVRLLDELTYVAPALEIALDAQRLVDAEAERLNQVAQAQQDPLWIEKGAWLAMFEAARLSIEHRAALCFR